MFAIPIFDAPRFFRNTDACGPMTIAVSSCLTGAAVRYDGASKTLPLLQTWPEKSIRLLPLCPEVGAGLSVPRPPVQLIAVGNTAPRARGRDEQTLDVTAALERFAETSLQRLLREPALCGYIWKSRSPSCGLGSTPLFARDGAQVGSASGIQAQRIATALPWLAHCEETQLAAPANAGRFLLQCHLVFDLRHTLAADAGALAPWYRHYEDFFGLLLPQDVRVDLQRHVARDDWQNCLALLHRRCETIEAEQLLGLFVKSAPDGTTTG